MNIFAILCSKPLATNIATGRTIIMAPESFSHLTIMNFITDNLIPVTIGNIIGGGLLVGLRSRTPGLQSCG
jgi:formate/nitrite transporter FocA (FNT family)